MENQIVNVCLGTKWNLESKIIKNKQIQQKIVRVFLNPEARLCHKQCKTFTEWLFTKI